MRHPKYENNNYEVNGICHNQCVLENRGDQWLMIKQKLDDFNGLF